MRPALQRLLDRPSSLDLLRILLQTSHLPPTSSSSRSEIPSSRRRCATLHAEAAPCGNAPATIEPGSKRQFVSTRETPNVQQTLPLEKSRRRYAREKRQRAVAFTESDPKLDWWVEGGPSHQKAEATSARRAVKERPPSNSLLPKGKQDSLWAPSWATRLEPGGSSLDYLDNVVKMAENDGVEVEPQPQEHKDSWIAHLMATRWISLNAAINTVHALGIETLGPLSLQAIALREPNAIDLAHRINELQERGITIGSSVYSRSLVSFAKRGQQELLQSLLESDQHPDTWDDATLRYKLLHKAIKDHDPQYTLIAAIHMISETDPVTETFNAELLRHAAARDHAALVRTLETMRIKRISVEVSSIRLIIRSILKPRKKGHQPDQTVPGYVKDDNDFAISVLKNILVYGGYVPASAWKEVTRRLGMVGRIDDLHSISMWLAKEYSPLRSSKNKRAAVPSIIGANDVSHSDDLHPFNILFGDIRQRSIVEWSFIHGLASYSARIRDNLELARMVPEEELKNVAAEKMVRGIRFLRRLQKRGVFVKETNVRRACYERLVILYGPGMSSRRYNRAVRPYNPLRLDELVAAIEEAWGAKLWPSKMELELRIAREDRWDAVLSSTEKEDWRSRHVHEPRKHRFESYREHKYVENQTYDDRM